MKSALFAAAAAVIACAGIATTVSVPASVAADAPALKTVADFQLTDHTRLAHNLYYYNYVPAIVIMSRVNGTPASRDNTAALERLAASYKDKGVLFFMIDSKTADTRDAIATEAAAQHVTIPILVDELQLVGENLGVQREGEVFVINPKTWQVAYHGPLADKTAPAIDAVMAGRAAPNPQVAVSGGQTITFASRTQRAQYANISYSKDIAPLLEEKCAVCHIEGGIGPFAMDGYAVVSGFAPTIRETLMTRRMPPYFADPHIGHFKDDQGMTAAQTQMLIHWIDAGAKRGDGPDPLAANKGKRAPDWPEELGQPDVIVTIPAFTVPATGLIPYQNPLVPNPFKEDTFLRAIAIKPGDRRVLHHVISDSRPDRTRPSSGLPGGSVGSYTPGARPQIIAGGGGAPVPGGGQLHYQLHYTTFGQQVTDQTQVGYYILKTPPTYIKRSTVIGDQGLLIPADAARHVEVAYLTAPADMLLYTLYPHSHYRGYHVELKMVTPDGKETMLLSLPRYDFNWQRDYDPVEPILIHAGTKLVATWMYDNSAHNAANPDHTRNVTWGEQTPDEMMYFRINYRFVDETPTHLRADLQSAMSATQAFGMIDDNVDGLIQPAELRGARYNSARANFAMYDRDGNGGLNATELASISGGGGGGFGGGGGGGRGGPGRGGAAAQNQVEIPDL